MSLPLPLLSTTHARCAAPTLAPPCRPVCRCRCTPRAAWSLRAALCGSRCRAQGRTAQGGAPPRCGRRCVCCVPAECEGGARCAGGPLGAWAGAPALQPALRLGQGLCVCCAEVRAGAYARRQGARSACLHRPTPGRPNPALLGMRGAKRSSASVSGLRRGRCTCPATAQPSPRHPTRAPQEAVLRIRAQHPASVGGAGAPTLGHGASPLLLRVQYVLY